MGCGSRWIEWTRVDGLRKDARRDPKQGEVRSSDMSEAGEVFRSNQASEAGISPKWVFSPEVFMQHTCQLLVGPLKKSLTGCVSHFMRVTSSLDPEKMEGCPLKAHTRSHELFPCLCSDDLYLIHGFLYIPPFFK